MQIIKKAAVLGIAVMAVGAGISAAHANSIDLDTANGSTWTVSRVLVGGESNTTVVTNQPVVEVANNPGWSQLSDPNAKWVSWNSDTGSGYTGDVNGTGYVYTDTFTLGNFTGAGAFTLSGSFLTDNYATGVSLTMNGAPVPVTLSAPLDPTEFGYHYSITVGALTNFTSPETFVLTINTVNSYADPTHLADGTNPGPTGFEFAGTATASAVPTPAAAWSGMSLLGAIAGFSLLRKRRLCA